MKDNSGRAKELNRTSAQKLCDLLCQVNGITVVTAKAIINEFLPEGSGGA